MMRVLIVEDDISLNRGVSFALKKDGFQVESVFSIKESESKFLESEFDLIILDVNLPDGNGFDFCMDVRRNSDVPIIFLTAQGSELEITNGLDMGADDYITKPFSVRELISRINALLRRTRKKSTLGILTSKEISLNKSAMKVEKSGKEITLSKKEILLLQYLMSNSKQILSKNQILSALWENDMEFVDENVVPVNIKRLREKIEENPKKPEYIQNIRGLGYIWAQGCVER